MIRWLFFGLALLVAGGTAEVRAESRLSIFDTHLHYSRAAWDGLKPAGVKALLAAAGVTRALVSSSPDDGTLKLRDFDAEMFVPEYRPYHGQVHSVNWLDDAASLSRMETRLSDGLYKGIGEFHLYGEKDGAPGALEGVVKLALEHGVPLHVHAAAPPVRKLFELGPDLRILWAHAGMSEPPDVIGPMLDQFPALSAELSFRAEDITDEKGDMDPAWRALLIRHADRFMIGSDTYENSRWAAYGDLIGAHRHWLAMLPAATARAIAFENAARMFGG